ncbi:MAG TPA: M15 family metallopeptidase [Clostridiales bacterium]|nr:M15 family metallopeptidase [Clostridiales bacterium]
MFHYTELAQEIKDRITGVSYADNCEVPYSELRYVQVLYWGFDGESHSGEMIVNKAIAADVVDIFKELYEAKYPIERMVLIDEYNADDNASMAANNTSAFCYRVIDNGSKRLSNHSYGLAIDINPLYNPYVRPIDGKTVISPEEGAEYADRTLDNPYYIRKGDICYQAFTSRGFTWGGDWKNPKDYQHFEKKLD